jgi:hypothetical protein
MLVTKMFYKKTKVQGLEGGGLRSFDGKIRDGSDDVRRRRKVVGGENGPSIRLTFISRCGGVEKPLKKTRIRSGADLGFELGTSPLQIGASSAWPQRSFWIS